MVFRENTYIETLDKENNKTLLFPRPTGLVQNLLERQPNKTIINNTRIELSKIEII